MQEALLAQERQADVVVVGYGGSGAATAIAAHDAGARVVVLEKRSVGGGCTRASGGTIRQIADPASAVTYFSALAHAHVPDEVYRTFVEQLAEIPDWLTGLGARVDDVVYDAPGSAYQARAIPFMSAVATYPSFPGGAAGLGGRVLVHGGTGRPGGEALWEVLDAAVRARGIEVVLDAPATRLGTDADGRVREVEHGGAAGPGRVIAARGVVLTCGGFSHNTRMQQDYLGVVVPSLSPPGTNDGDGVLLAQDLGADLWHMNAAVGHFGYRIPDATGGAALMHLMTRGFVIVDQRGHRYYDETALEAHGTLHLTRALDPVEGRYLRIPSYLVFGQDTLDAGPLTNRHNLGADFEWSPDNRRELERGWIRAAPDAIALATELGLPAGQLSETLTRYDAAATDPFGRPAGEMAPIGAGPLYAIELWPVLLNTQGGPRRDADARVLDVFDRPIPGLYAAGELGSIWSDLYPGAGNVSECLAFGRIAGACAAADAG